MIFLDSDVSIAILRGNISLHKVLHQHPSAKFAITAPSVFELYNGLHWLKYSKKKISKVKYDKLEKALETFLDNLLIFEFDMKSAKRASEISNHLKGNGQEINQFDCLIAAIILENNYSDILTYNINHFDKIEGLNLISTSE